MNLTQWQVITLLAGAGLGTYLLRYLPMRWYVLLRSAFEQPLLRAALTALGPAAIVALLIVSLKGLVRMDETWQTQQDLLRIIVALAAIAVSRKLYKNTIVATFIGVAVYGGVLWLQGV